MLRRTVGDGGRQALRSDRTLSPNRHVNGCHPEILTLWPAPQVANTKPWRHLLPFNTLSNDHVDGFLRHRRPYNRSEQYSLQHSPNVTRLLWVRHPVARILSGWHHVSNGTPSQFRRFVEEELPSRYDASCAAPSMLRSLDPFEQHYLPPQHCRCGLPCHVRYRVLHMECCPIQQVLRRRMGNSSIFPPDDVSRVNTHKLDMSAYLSRAVLATLNRLTEVEQQIFGYCRLLLRGGEAVADEGCPRAHLVRDGERERPCSGVDLGWDRP